MNVTSRPEARVALEMTGGLRLQSRDAAAGLGLWAEDTGVSLQVLDVGATADELEDIYRAWGRAPVDILLLPYGSGQVRDALRGVSGEGLAWNHGGSDDELARPWAPMVPAPASTYFVPLVDLAARRGCRSLTVVQNRGGFAGRVSRGAIGRARRLDLSARVVALSDWEAAEPDPAGAVLVVGRFQDDVAVVPGLRGRCELVGCVAAGIPAFGEELGADAEGVLGPVQWWADDTVPEHGPSGEAFARRYRDRHGRVASYVAAQAAAAGYLALAAGARSLTVAELERWSTSTLLGDFRVDGEGRQVGHRVVVVEWRDGRMTRVT